MVRDGAALAQRHGGAARSGSGPRGSRDRARAIVVGKHLVLRCRRSRLLPQSDPVGGSAFFGRPLYVRASRTPAAPRRNRCVAVRRRSLCDPRPQAAMTIVRRPRASLFHAEGGWFSANWHFSFDQYFDEANMGIGDLRVFNHDRLVPGAAWPMHPHRDIEGITYVAEGTFEHADTRGNGGVLHPGAVQRATLGSGMQHSERNGSKTEPMRFIQMWIMPSHRGLEPSIEQSEFPAEARRNRLKPVLVPAAGYGQDCAPRAADAVTVHQDSAVYAGLLDANTKVRHEFRPRFGGYLFVVHGALVRPQLDEGGAAKIQDEPAIDLEAGPNGAEVLLVETRTSTP